MLKSAIASSTGTFNGVASGSAVNGTAIFIGNVCKKVANLSAVCTLLAETNTLTLSVKWQVSADNSTWYDLALSPQNPSAVVFKTGTAGADTAGTLVVPAPEAVYGWAWARAIVVVGGTTGTTSDTYTISYNYRQLTGAEAALS